ncbi:MAG: ATP-binding protein [Candidatus Binatia bacterium]
MRWRNRVLFLILVFPALAACASAGALLFTPPPHSTLLWFTLLSVAAVALAGALLFGLRLQRRLRDLHTFVAAVLKGNLLPSLPVWGQDEVGALEQGLQRLISRQYDRMRALQGERKKLEAVLQSMAEGVVVIDPAGNVVLCNRAWQEWFGLSPETDWQEKPLQTFSRHPLLHELLREVAGKRPSDQPVTREIEIEGKGQRSLAVSAMQVCEDGVTVSGYVLVFHDLTQLKKLEAVRADFVANVSHELRTPLTAIKGYAETLLNGALADPETARRFLTIIDRHSERLSRLLEDLLTLSDLELGKTELRRDEIVFTEIVSEVFDVVKDKAERGGVTLTQEIPDSLPAVIGDGDQLHQVLINLIDNAVKYTPAGGTVTVTATAVQSPKSKVQSPNPQIPSLNGVAEAGREEEWLEVAIADTGCGIPEAEIPRLTQRFYRVDKARSRELGGTGLGLAIVKHIVQAHDGLLRIESQINQGTTVHLFLPLRPFSSLTLGQVPSAVLSG